ncbi:MAG: MFS transporter [Gammaproteobacteria bacterium]
MSNKRGVFTYENGLLIILGMSFGVAFFDRNAAGILVPYIDQDLHLTNTQTAFLGSGLSIAWALGAYIIARWSDARGVRKPFLLSFLIIFSVCSVLAGLATTYPILLASRMIMGAVEGPFLPICLAIMAVESSEHRRGVNAGIMQNFFAALLGQGLAPLVLVPLAETFGWRSAFFLAGVPGLICAAAVWLWVREPTLEEKAKVDAQGPVDSGARMGLMDMLRLRNIFLCCLISMFMVGWFVLGWTFLPKFLTEYRGFPGQTMAYLMTALGISAAVAGFFAPAISDRFGRKPVMITFCLAGVATPLAAMYFQGSLFLLAAFFFVGWLGSGTFPLFMGVIPGETISRRYAATAMGVVVCVGEVVGGFGIVSIAGKLADMTSLAAPILLQIGCALVGGLLCLFLVETAPAKVKAGAARAVAAGA